MFAILRPKTVPILPVPVKLNGGSARLLRMAEDRDPPSRRWAQRREGQHEGSRLAHGKGHRPLPPRPRPFHRDDSSDAELGMDHSDPGTEGVKIHRPCGACRADSAFRRRSRQLGRRRQAKLARAGPRPRVRFWPARPSAGTVARDALRRFDARAIVMFHGLGGQFLQEPGRKGRLLLAPECPDPAAAEVELALGPGDADEKQPPFLFQLLIVIIRTRVWGSKPSSSAFTKTTGNSRPLAACSVINVTAAGLLVPAVDGRGQRDLGQEVVDRGPGMILVELASRRDQFVEVRQAILAVVARRRPVR